MVAISLAIFAFLTLLGWSYYGERCWQFLFKEKSVMIYRVLWVVAILWFANQKIDFIGIYRYLKWVNGYSQCDWFINFVAGYF